MGACCGKSTDNKSEKSVKVDNANDKDATSSGGESSKSKTDLPNQKSSTQVGDGDLSVSGSKINKSTLSLGQGSQLGSAISRMESSRVTSKINGNSKTSLSPDSSKAVSSIGSSLQLESSVASGIGSNLGSNIDSSLSNTGSNLDARKSSNLGSKIDSNLGGSKLESSTGSTTGFNYEAGSSTGSKIESSASKMKSSKSRAGSKTKSSH